MAETDQSADADWLEEVNRALYRYDHESGFGVREVAEYLAVEVRNQRAAGWQEGLNDGRSLARMF